MRILHLTYRDTSGVPSRWAAAHMEAGHEALILAELPHPYGYPGQQVLHRWTPGSRDAEERAHRIGGFLDWADAVMAYDHPYYLDTAIVSGKPVLFRALGTSSRDHADEIRALLAAPNVMRATAGTPDLALLLDVELAGAPYPVYATRLRDGRTSLVHAPSDRNLKQTHLIVNAAAETGWHLDLVEAASNREVLARKMHAAAVADSGPGSVPAGYGVNSVEAMALGLPTIAGADGEIRDLLEQAGCPVLFVADQDELIAALDWLRDPAERARLGQDGCRFVQRFHNPAARAAEDVEALTLVAA